MNDVQPTAAVLIIGNEILSGRTQDTNLAFLAKALDGLGIRLFEARIVADIEAEIIAALNTLRARHAYVFTTGGIGPTHDDITAASVAKAFGVPIRRHPDAVALLTSHYAPGDLTEARLKMAELPEGAEMIANPISKAPGIRMGNVFVLAGVPAICRAMFETVRPLLEGGPKRHARTVSCALGEGVIAKDLEAIQDRFATTEIGSYPYYRREGFGVSLVVRGLDLADVEGAANAIRAMIVRHGAVVIDEPEAGG